MNVGTERYRPVRLLGQGGMGAVYEVDDTVKGGRLAMKVMLTQDARLLLRFKQEFRIVAELHHRNLIRLYELGCENDRWFFTMELVEGQSLLEALLREPDLTPLDGASTLGSDELTFSAESGVEFAPDAETDAETGAEPARAGRRAEPACHMDAFGPVIAQVLDALEFLHQRGVVHRDLKPGNILVDIHGVVRVLDFGLASRVDRSVAISRDGAMVGTLAYMAPEQCLGEEATPASDMYALGCILFELLTGAAPFPGNVARSIQARLGETAPRVDERTDGVPPAIVEICQRLMAREPADRPTIDEVREALEIELRKTGSGSNATGDRAHDGPASGHSIDRRHPFVGRQRELAVLGDWLDAPSSGGPVHFALLSGASGIGKSALAAMVGRRARQRGFLHFHGRCYERERVPFVAFDRAVDAMILTMARWPRARLDPIRELLEPLRRLFPAIVLLDSEVRQRSLLEDRAARPVSGSSQDGEQSSSAIDLGALHSNAFDAFCQLLEHIQSQAPLLFVLEDLHWASEESAALLDAVLERVAGRVFVLGTFRPGGIDGEHPMSPLVHHERAVRLALGALRPEEAIELVDAVAGSRLDPATAAALADHAEGNPFLTVQMADYLAQVTEGAAFDSSERAELFDESVDGLLRGRIAALSERAELVLSLAATAGGDVASRLLIDAGERLDGLTFEDFELAMGELLALRLCKAVRHALNPGVELVVQGGPLETGPADDSSPHGIADSAERERQWNRTRIDLCHDRIRESAYDRLDPERRVALHRALAEALEARSADAPGKNLDLLESALESSNIEALLRHWTAAGDRDRRRHYALVAARRATEKLAFRHAVRLFRVTLDDPEPDADARELAARWEEVGELCDYSAHLDEATDSYLCALVLWEEAMPEETEGRREALVRLKGRLGETMLTVGRVAEGRAMFRDGLALMGLPLERSRTGRIATLAWLGLRLALASVLPSRSSGEGKTQMVSEQIRFLESLFRVFLPAWPGLSVEAAMRSELLARRADDKQIVQRAMASRAIVAIALRPVTPRRLARTRQGLDHAETMARTHELPLGLELVQMYRSVMWMAIDASRARRLNEAAQEALARRGMTDFYYGAMARMVYVLILFMRGDYDDALAAIAEEMHVRRSNFLNLVFAMTAKTRIHFHRGQRDEADEVIRQLEEHLEGAPMSGMSLQLEMARCGSHISRGRFAEALDLAWSFERESGLFTGLLTGSIKSFWSETIADASEGLARRGGFVGYEHRPWARRHIRWLTRNGTFDMRVTGHRALAMIAHVEGKARAARRALGRALDLSAVNTNPYRRWLCLEAARDMGAMTSELEPEAADLVANLGLRLPMGWRE